MPFKSFRQIKLLVYLISLFSFGMKGRLFAQYPALPTKALMENLFDLKRVESIAQLKDGRCFLGSADGISEWRGNSIITHSLYSLDSTLSREVSYVYAEDSTRIWYSCYPQGWGYYEPDSRKLVNFQKKIPNAPRGINAVFRDKQNRLWLASNNENEKEQAGLYLFKENEQTLLHYRFAPKTEFHFRQNTDRINSINQDIKGNLWLASWAGLVCFNPETNFKKVYGASYPGNPFQLYTFLKWANDSILLAGSWGRGLIQLNINSRQSKNFLIHQLPKHRGTHNIFLDICEAKPGLFVIASLDAGVLLFDFNKQKLFSMQGVRGMNLYELSSGIKRCLKTHSGDVILSSADYGIIRMQAELFQNSYYFFTGKKEILNALHSIQFDSLTKVYIGLSIYGNSLFLFDKNFLKKEIIQPYKADANFHLAFHLNQSNWLIQSSKGWFTLNTNTGMVSFSLPNHFNKLQARFGKVWVQNNSLIGLSTDSAFIFNKQLKLIKSIPAKGILENADGNCVYLLNRYLISCNRKGRLRILDFESYKTREHQFSYLPGIKSCLPLPNGNWLLVNFEAAFVIKNPLSEKPIVQQLNTKTLNKGTNFQDLAQTNSGIYLISEFGLVKFNPFTNQIEAVPFPDERSYFQTNYIRETGEWAFGNAYNVILKKDKPVSKKNDWFGVVNVLVNQGNFWQFHPAKSTSISLNPNQNFLDLEFGSFLPNTNAAYRYQLSGIDEHIQSDLNKGHAVYSNLDPGTYTFKVWRRVDFSEWEEGMPLQIVLAQVWYKKNWFKLLLLLLLGAGVFWFLHNRRKEKERKSALQKARLEADLKALRSQMNPHFIFNSLNSINRYIIKNDPVNASDYLSKFARLIRMILDHSNEKTITISKEIQFLNYYLELEQVRLNHAFHYELDIHPSVNSEQDQIQPMLLQPFLENAIWHGIMNKPEKNGQLLIRFTKEAELLRVEIRDNGVGRKHAALLKPKRNSASVGIQLTRDRLHLLDPQAQIEFIDLMDEQENPEGTCVIVTFKINSLHD